MTESAVLLGFSYFLFCLFFAAVHSWRVGRLNLLDWAVLSMGGGYGLGWVVVIWVTTQGKNPGWERWLLPFESFYLLHTAAAFILLIREPLIN